MQVIISKQLPIHPSAGEVARRMVRHGLADVLAWLGEKLGPRPDELTHAIAGADPASRFDVGVLFVSEEYHHQLRRAAGVAELNHPERARRQDAERDWLRSAREHQRSREAR